MLMDVLYCVKLTKHAKGTQILQTKIVGKTFFKISSFVFHDMKVKNHDRIFFGG